MELEYQCRQYSTDNLDDLSTSQCLSDFRILHINIRSLRKNFDKLLALLDIFPFAFHVICLTETFLYQNEHTCFPLPNYLFLADSRATKQGGAGFYVHSSLAVEEQLVTLDGAEAISVRLSGAVVRPLYLTCIYRTGAADLGKFLDSLDCYLNTMSLSDHIITGDLNIDTLKSESDHYVDIISHYNFQNIIPIPTRISSTSQTCIDHILINFNTHKIQSGTLLTDTSDHLPVFAIFKKFSIIQNDEFSYRNLNVSEERVNEIFSSVSWESVLNSFDVNHAYADFLKIFTSCFDQACPVIIKKTRKKAEKVDPPWFTQDLRLQIKKRDKLYENMTKYPFSPKLRLKFVKHRNSVTSLLREAKEQYYDSLISGINDPRKLWNTINIAIGRKSAVNRKNSIHSLKLTDSSIVSNPNDIAEGLNAYFTSIGPSLAAKIPIAQTVITPCDQLKPETSFQFSQIDPCIVRQEISKLDIKKAVGPDKIPSKFIKSSLPFITEPLTHVINLSLSTSTVPDSMKIARVMALYKNKGEKTSPSNYRPISILPIFSKILEKIVNTQLQTFLSDNNVIFTNQYGFQKSKNTSDALIDFSNKCFKALNDSESVLGIFIDFSKAFDTVDHSILLKKLEVIYDFSEAAISWFSSYLSNRKQFVQLDDIGKSTEKQISCGVPQGSILGPTLFILYINDLMIKTDFFEPILFADDTNLFVKSKNLNIWSSEINENLDKVYGWCNNNKLTLNVDKTNIILIKNHQNNFQLREEIKMNGKPLQLVNELRFLGVIINPSLNWANHLSHLRTELNKISGLLFISSKFLPRKSLILLYNALAHSKLVYCIEAWGNAPAIHLRKAIVIQKRMIRTIFKKNPREHSVPFFKSANVLPIPELYTHRISLYAHDIFYNNTRPTPYYNTRRTNIDLPLPPSTSTVGHRQPAYQASAAWNQLPVDIREIKNTSTFKVVLKQHLLASLE